MPSKTMREPRKAELVSYRIDPDLARRLRFDAVKRRLRAWQLVEKLIDDNCPEVPDDAN